MDSILADKNKILKQIQNEVVQLNNNLAFSQKASANLQLELNVAAKQLYRAEKLVTGLSSERKRWQEIFEHI
mgnify:CR=1 FL=1